MATKRAAKGAMAADQRVSASADDLLLAALERGGDTGKTGRFLMTFKEGATAAGIKSLQSKRGLRVASARDFQNQAMDLQQTGDADAVVFPEIGVALVGSGAAAAHGLTTAAFAAEDSPTHSADPEYFMFATQINPGDYLKGVIRTAEMIYADLGETTSRGEVSAAAVGVTWGLAACKVPASSFNGNGIKVAVLETGFVRRPSQFAGRTFVTNT